MSEPLPAEQRRASHADREAVVERLRDAAGDGRLTLDELEQRIDAAYAARTYADLEPLTHDLPDDAGAVARVPQRASTAPARVTGSGGRRWSVALMSGTERRGRWRIGANHSAAALMGGVDIDLRAAEMEAPVVTIWAFALMGGIDVIVPDDCVMDASGFGLMGAFDDSDTAPPAPAGAPVVRVRGFALMGGIDVRRRPAKGADPRGDAARLDGGNRHRGLGPGHGQGHGEPGR